MIHAGGHKPWMRLFSMLTARNLEGEWVVEFLNRCQENTLNPTVRQFKAKELDCKFSKKNISISLRQGDSLPILDGVGVHHSTSAIRCLTIWVSGVLWRSKTRRRGLASRRIKSCFFENAMSTDGKYKDFWQLIWKRRRRRKHACLSFHTFWCCISWWKCALVGDQEIDTQRVDSTCKQST